MSETTKKYRIENITHQIPGQPTTGFALDFENKIFTPTSRPLVLDDLPQIVQEWQEKGFVRVRDADTGEAIGGGFADGVVVAGPRVDTIADNGEGGFEEDEVGFDPTAAREADMSVLAQGAHSPSLEQHRKAKVSLGQENERHNDSDVHSPIPGDRPRSVDDSGDFTIKAPHQNGVGAVIGR